jgi:hypothetical protein
MTMGLKSRRFLQFAVLAIAAGEISAVAAEVLVLRSVGPSARRYPSGQRLPDNASFTLRAGDTIVVLSRAGTRTLRGPGTCNAAGAGCTGRLASANVRVGTGATRSSGDTGPVARPTDVWQVDVTQSGRACVAAGARPTLWRPASASAVQLTITPQTGTPQTVNWAQGQATLPWPAAIPIVDGASYQLNWTGGASPTRLTARSVAAVPAGDVSGLATALLTNQCRGQLDTLIAQSEAPAPAPGGGTTR